MSSESKKMLADRYNWVLEIAIKPKSSDDREKLGKALAELAAEDPLFHVHTDQESGQTLLRGMGELHLDAKIDVLRRTHKVELNVGPPQVAYRETITRPVRQAYTHVKPSGEGVQYAAVAFDLMPNEAGSGNTFVSKIAAGEVPQEYISSVEKGVESVFGSGPLVGFPMIDVGVALSDCKYRHPNSTPLAFELATRTALQEALKSAAPILKEPIMRIEVHLPVDRVGVVMRDLKRRRGRGGVRITMLGDTRVVEEMVPLANMFAYASTLRSVTNGRGTYTMEFDHYDVVPHGPDNDPRFRPAMAMRA